MGGNYGIFPKILVGISTILAVWAAAITLFSHPLGFLASIIILGIGGGFNSLVHYAFAPEFGAVYDGTEEPDTSEPEYVQGPLSRILSVESPTDGSTSRLLGTVDYSGTTQPETNSEEKQRRKDDKAWAEMFRAV